MSSPADPYRDWGAAYVLGSLSPAERREFESHLAGCADCTAEVTSLAGVPGILSVVPRSQAADLLDLDLDDHPSLLPGLVAADRSRRRRARAWMAAAVFVAALAGAAVTVAVRPAPVAPPDVAMHQIIPSPVTANVLLVAEPWGTRIEVRCSYALPADGPPPPTFAYGLYVTDSSGTEVLVATWTAGPGSTTRPTATTELVRSNITAVEIRLQPNNTVLLRVDV